MSSPTKEWISMLDQQITKDFANTDYNQTKAYSIKLPISVIAGIKLSTLTAEVKHINNDQFNYLIFSLSVRILNNYQLQSTCEFNTNVKGTLNYNIYSEHIQLGDNDESDFQSIVFKNMSRLHSILYNIRFSKLDDKLISKPIYDDNSTLDWSAICKTLPNCEPLYETCSVCFDETSTFTKCKHCLCRHCSQHLKSNTCPICRTQLNK